VKVQRMVDRINRARAMKEKAEAAKRRELAERMPNGGPSSKCLDPHATQAGLDFFNTVIGDRAPFNITTAADGSLNIVTNEEATSEAQTAALNLLLVDSEIFLPTLQAILYNDPPWSVSILPKGVDFMGLPLIPRMHTLKEDFTLAWKAGFEVFDSTPGLLRFGNLRNLTFNIWAPGRGRRDDLLHMTRNIQFLAKLIQDNQNAKGNLEPLYSLTINLCDPFEDRAGDYSLINANIDNLHITRDRNWLILSAWSKPIESSNNSEIKGYTPAEALMNGTMAIYLVTLPFRRLRNITNVTVNLPQELRGHERAEAFKTGFEAELKGSDDLDLSDELKLETFFDRQDEMDYDRKINEMKQPGYECGSAQNDPALDWYYRNKRNAVNYSDQDFWMNPDNDVDVGSRSRDTTLFNEYWDQGIVSVSALMRRET
jgi:hypothetical protein